MQALTAVGKAIMFQTMNSAGKLHAAQSGLGVGNSVKGSTDALIA